MSGKKLVLWPIYDRHGCMDVLTKEKYRMEEIRNSDAYFVLYTVTDD